MKCYTGPQIWTDSVEQPVLYGCKMWCLTLRSRWEDNTEMSFREIGYEDVICMGLIQDHVRW
jgi:hypothetical protein